MHLDIRVVRQSTFFFFLKNCKNYSVLILCPWYLPTHRNIHHEGPHQRLWLCNVNGWWILSSEFFVPWKSFLPYPDCGFGQTILHPSRLKAKPLRHNFPLLDVFNQKKQVQKMGQASMMHIRTGNCTFSMVYSRGVLGPSMTWGWELILRILVGWVLLVLGGCIAASGQDWKHLWKAVAINTAKEHQKKCQSPTNSTPSPNFYFSLKCKK